MKLYYNKDNGEIVGTIEGFGNHNGVDISIPNISIESIDITVGHPLEQWARDLENPDKKEITVNNYRFNGKKFIKISQSELEKQKKNNQILQEEAKQKREETLSKIKDTSLSNKERLDILIKFLNID